MIKKGKVTLLQRFPMDLFSTDVNVYMRRHKSSLFATISLNGNYGLFTHSDVSYRFNGENDNVVLEFVISQCSYFELRSHDRCVRYNAGVV